MKKVLTLILVLAMILSLAACGGAAGNDSDSTTAPADDAATTTKAPETEGSDDEDTTTPGGDASDIVVGFSQIGAESDWRVANTNSIRSSIEEAGFTLIFDDAQQKQENQIKALRNPESVMKI